MSVSTVTDSYLSIDWSVVSVTPAGTNVTDWERDAVLAVAEVVVLAVIFMMALLGNGLVLVVLLRRRRRHNPLHQFMLNLCVADLVVALFQVTHTHTGTHTHTVIPVPHLPPLPPCRSCPSWCGMLRGASPARTSCAAW